MTWKYELTGDASQAEFAVPGTGELVTLKKGKTVELDRRVGELPPGVKVTEVKKKAEKAEAEEEAS